MSREKQAHDLRLHLAQEAARLIEEQGIRDFRVAKDKAAASLGLKTRGGPMPRNTEIETALAERQRLFGGAVAAQRLRKLRRAATEAMVLFAAFHPRLVGDVLTGLANAHSDVQLHLFADHSEAFDLFLQDQGIPYRLGESRFRFGRGAPHCYPAFQFTAGDVGFRAVVFPLKGIRQAPDSLVDATPMARAKRAEVDELLRDG
ncbi:MAG: hypothetical protein L0H19_02230 [Salinisphaera sp.]|nr:hypothetical protein [Salinisphaera sp.]MDN5939434.1 hypothetical protein [Salinisphaera sp.]